MNKKVSKFIKKESAGVKDLTKDLIPRFASLLNPQIWQSPETIQSGLISIATGFLSSRIRNMLEDISKNENIDPEVLECQQTKQVLLKLAKFAAQENPDMEVWEASKKIFIQALQKNVGEKERTSLYEFIDICKELKGTEIKIIAGAYHIYKTPGLHANGHPLDVKIWATRIAEFIGFETLEGVLRHENNLVQQLLIFPRGTSNGSTWDAGSPSQWHRLTPLGLTLCRTIIDQK